MPSRSNYLCTREGESMNSTQFTSDFGAYKTFNILNMSNARRKGLSYS